MDHGIIPSPHNPPTGPDRIPTELLSEIFLHCAEGTMDTTNTIRTPLLLSQICPRWRQTALATPRLWSRLFLQFNTSHAVAASPTSFPSSAPLTELVQTWLTRSGGCPLTIYVFWERPPFTPSHPVLEALVEHSDRWQSMFFYMPFKAFKSLFKIRKHLPLLTELSLGSKDEPPSSSELIGKVDVFADAPRLRSLECVNFSPLIFKFPWSRLTTIPMMAVTIDDFLDVILLSSHLEKGGFIFMDGFNPDLPTVYSRNIRVQSDSLRQFTIMTPQWNEEVDLRGLFPQLTFPNLEELNICNLSSPFCSGFVGFLSRLRCLRTLHLRKTALTDHQLLEGLAHLPSLSTLIVYSAPRQAPTVTHDFLSALTWHPTLTTDSRTTKRPRLSKHRNILPYLTKLELTVDYNVSDAFVEMVRSRVLAIPTDYGTHMPIILGNPRPKDLPTRLERIRIRPTEDLGDRAYTHLAEIASYGVEISVEDLDNHAGNFVHANVSEYD